MWLHLITSKAFWKIVAELLLMEFVISFADTYETAKQDAYRRIHDQGDRDRSQGYKGPPGFPG